MTFSKILLVTGIFVIGYWSVMLFVFDVLSMGVIVETVQSCGNVKVLMARLKMHMSGKWWESLRMLCTYKYWCTPSGPTACFGHMHFRALSTSLGMSLGMMFSPEIIRCELFFYLASLPRVIKITRNASTNTDVVVTSQRCSGVKSAVLLKWLYSYSWCEFS